MSRRTTASGHTCTPLVELLLCFFYSDLSKEVPMVPRVDIPPAVWFLLAIVVPTLLPLEDLR